MAFNNDSIIEFLIEEGNKEIKKELKITRKRNGKWEEVRSYPCPNQCLKIRNIAPRGMQKIFRTTKKVKSFLWFKKEVEIKLINTYIPEKKNKEYFWKQIRSEVFASRRS